MSDASTWLLFTLFWTIVMSFYSMQEMAAISCNKLRLDYFVAQKRKWALYLLALLEKPGILFSTTLIGVNAALMLSSEGSRRLFVAWGLDPDLAPLAEIPFVLIFGELIPIFAARLYPDHTSRLGSPILYFSSKVLSPLYSIGSFLFRLKQPEQKGQAPFLSRDELQKLLQEQHHTPDEPLHAVIGNIFTLKNKRAYQLMRPLEQFPSASTRMTIGALRELAIRTEQNAYYVYVRAKQKVVGMIYPKELLNASDTKKVDDFTEPCCFVTQQMHALELFERLQEEDEQIAIVLNEKGEALGVIVLDDVLDELFNQEVKGQEVKSQEPLSYLEKTVSGDTKIIDFNEANQVEIDPEGCKTFAELVEKLLGRHPSPQDTISIEPLEIVVKETTLFKAKTLQVRTKSK